MAVKRNKHIQMRESEFRKSMDGAVRAAYEIAFTCMLVAAHDKFGFGDIRLERLLDHAMKISQELNDGDISLDDLMGALKDDNIKLGFEYIVNARGFMHPVKKRK